jgi:hypothetical protein
MPSTMMTSRDWETRHEVLPTQNLKAQDFDGYKRIITDLYITEDHSLDAVIQIMADRYKFYGK